MCSQVLQVVCHLFFYLGKIVINRLSIFDGCKGRYSFPMSLEIPGDLEERLLTYFSLGSQALNSYFRFSFSLLYSFFFPFFFCTCSSPSKWCHSPEVIHLHIVPLLTSHLFSGTMDRSNLCVYQRLLNMKDNRGVSKTAMNIKYLRMYS